jgi:Kef-type K+ transport system membrane component KefB
LALRFAVLGAYLFTMVGFVRPLLRRLLPPDRSLTRDRLAAIVILLLSSVWATEVLEIHALFGAFLAGLVMPKYYRLESGLRERLESVTLALLLPLFFVYNGLRTSSGLITGMDLWLVSGIIIGVAVASNSWSRPSASALGGSRGASRWRLARW